MSGINKLTDTKIKKTQPSDKIIQLGDGDRLWLVVYPLRKKGLAGQMEKRLQAGSIHHWPLSGYFTEAGQNGTGQDYRTAGSGN